MREGGGKGVSFPLDEIKGHIRLYGRAPASCLVFKSVWHTLSQKVQVTIIIVEMNEIL